MKWSRGLIVIGALLLAGCQAKQATVPDRPAAVTQDARARDQVQMRQWGQETLELIETRFRMPERDLLAEQVNTMGRQERGRWGKSEVASRKSEIGGRKSEGAVSGRASEKRRRG